MRTPQPTGKEALDRWNEAMSHFRAGRYDEALKVKMRNSDRSVIERYIAEKKAMEAVSTR